MPEARALDMLTCWRYIIGGVTDWCPQISIAGGMHELLFSQGTNVHTITNMIPLTACPMDLSKQLDTIKSGHPIDLPELRNLCDASNFCCKVSANCGAGMWGDYLIQISAFNITTNSEIISNRLWFQGLLNISRSPGYMSHIVSFVYGGMQ